MMANECSKLQQIYNHETNIRLEWFWDTGVDATIGDETNGWGITHNFETVSEAIDWLYDNTRRSND